MADATAPSHNDNVDESMPPSPAPTPEELAAMRRLFVLKTSHEWYHEADGWNPATDNQSIVIQNVDGWRDLDGEGCVAPKYWYYVPITRIEFYDRYWRCTMRPLAPGETIANMPDPYERPYDDAHIAYIWRAAEAVLADHATECTKGKCQGQHDLVMEAFCAREEPRDAWDISLAYEHSGVMKDNDK